MRRVMWGMIVLVTVLLQGCGNSENEAPTVSTESAFTCNQVNNLNARGDTSSANRMVAASIAQLNAAYTEDTPVQRFYRGLVQKNVDYAYQFRRAIDKSCLAKPSQGLNDAATSALNTAYAETSKQARWTTCRFFNDKSIKADDVYAEIGNPNVITIGGDAPAQNMIVAANAAKYGKDYILKGVTERCAANPDYRLWNVFGAVAGVAVQEINAEQQRIHAEQEAEQKRIRHAADLAKYGVDMTSDGDATCQRFDWALRLANERDEPERFQEAAQKTLQSLSVELPPYQRVVFDADFSKNPGQLAQEVRNICNSTGARVRLIDALRNVQTIKFARTEGQQFFDKLRVEKAAAAGCKPGECTSNFESMAVLTASVNFERCERGERGGNLVCLPEPRDFYDFALATAYVAEIDRRLKQLDEQEKQIPNKLLMSPELEACKHKLISAGYRGSQFSEHAQTDCMAPLGASLRAPLEENRAKLQATRTQWAGVANKLLAQAKP